MTIKNLRIHFVAVFLILKKLYFNEVNPCTRFDHKKLTIVAHLRLVVFIFENKILSIVVLICVVDIQDLIFRNASAEILLIFSHVHNF